MVVGRDNTPFCKSTSCSHSSHGQWHAFNSVLACNIQTWEHWCTLSFNSLLDHRDNYCSAVGCYKIVQCYLVSQVQNNCCPTKRQCVALCSASSLTAYPPLLMSSSHSYEVRSLRSPSLQALIPPRVTSPQKQQNLNPSHQDLCGVVGEGADAESKTFIKQNVQLTNLIKFAKPPESWSLTAFWRRSNLFLISMI